MQNDPFIHVSIPHVSSFFSFSESVHHLLDENQRFLSQLTSLLQDTTQEMEHSIMVCYTGVREGIPASKHIHTLKSLFLFDLAEDNSRKYSD